MKAQPPPPKKRGVDGVRLSLHFSLNPSSVGGGNSSFVYLFVVVHNLQITSHQKGGKKTKKRVGG